MVTSLCLLVSSLLGTETPERVPGGDELVSEIRYAVDERNRVSLQVHLVNRSQRELNMSLPVGTPFGVGADGTGVLLAKETVISLQPGETWEQKLPALAIGPLTQKTGAAGPVDITQVEPAIGQLIEIIKQSEQGTTEADPLEIARWVLGGRDDASLEQQKEAIFEAGGESLWNDIQRTRSRLTPVPGPPLAPSNIAVALGMELMTPTAEFQQHAGISGGTSVTHVASGSIAARLGIRRGDVIHTVNDLEVEDPDGLEQMLRAAARQSAVKLRILDQASSRELTLPLPRFGQRYQHPSGVFSVPIPEGWFVVAAHRNTVADQNFDSLTSPDGRQVMIVYRSFMPASDREDLFAYEAAKMREADRLSQARRERFSLRDHTAFRVFYRTANQQEVVSRVAFFGPGAIFVINCVHPTSANDALPTEMREALQGLHFQ